MFIAFPSPRTDDFIIKINEAAMWKLVFSNQEYIRDWIKNSFDSSVEYKEEQAFSLRGGQSKMSCK